jgi:hypothetical protein
MTVTQNYLHSPARSFRATFNNQPILLKNAHKALHPQGLFILAALLSQPAFCCLINASIIK